MENKVIILSLSSKKDGNCESIANRIYTLFDNRTNVVIYKFSDFIITPCGRCSYQCFADNTACPYIEDMEYTLLDEICGSKVTFFVIPNYCDYPCSNFFVFNERSQCYFQNHPERLDRYLSIQKKFIVVSNSKSENFVNAFLQHTNEEPKILYLSAREHGKRSTAGDLMTAEGIHAKLKDFVFSE